MYQRGQFSFPDYENFEEANAWKKTFRRRALHSQILVVAVTRIEGTWKAYIGPVPGHNHDVEWESVYREGNDVGEKLARVLFPDFEGVPYAK